ncbi:hypothetical protein AHAS_Ahas03G0174900 [Arachis hypogaea]
MGRVHGERVFPNVLKRRSLKGGPVSTRIRNEMDQIEPALDRCCGLCREVGHTG